MNIVRAIFRDSRVQAAIAVIIGVIAENLIGLIDAFSKAA